MKLFNTAHLFMNIIWINKKNMLIKIIMYKAFHEYANNTHLRKKIKQAKMWRYDIISPNNTCVLLLICLFVYLRLWLRFTKKSTKPTFWFFIVDTKTMDTNNVRMLNNYKTIISSHCIYLSFFWSRKMFNNDNAF